MATVEAKQKTFTKGGNPLRAWGKGVASVANALGVQVVSEQPSAPKQEFMTAPTVNPTAPTLGEVRTTQVDFGQPAAASVAPTESPLGSVPPVPEMQPANTLDSVPPVPAAQTPVPDAFQNAFKNDTGDVLNPTVVPVETPKAVQDVVLPPAPEVPPTVVPAERTDDAVSAESETVKNVTPVVEPEASDDPLVNNPEPIAPPSETQNTVSSPEPVKIPEDPLVNNPEPIVTSASMAAPAIVPSDHIVENSPEVPNAFHDAFAAESEDSLDPQKTEGKSEFDVKVNSIADNLIKENSSMFIKLNAQGEPELDEAGFDAAIFVEEVQAKPTFKNLLDQLEKRGVTPKTAMDALKTYIK